MLEVEIKAHILDPKKISKRINRLGGIEIDKKWVKDTYYDHSKLNLTARRKELRIREINRKIGREAVLTYKSPPREIEEAREEIEVKLSSAKGMRRVLEEIGFYILGRKEKVITSYLLKGAKIEIVHVKGLGDFIEIEIKTEKESGEKEKIYSILKDLGIDLRRVEYKPYLEMLREIKGDMKGE